MGGRVTGRSIAYAATQVRPALLISLTFNSSHFLSKLVFSLCSAKDWKKKHAGFHFPSFYNFILDTLENPEDDLEKKCADELLQWWSRYVYVQYTASGVLISSPLFSKVFPATDSRDSGANSRRAMLDCRKQLREGRARRAGGASAHNGAVRSSAPDNAVRASAPDNAVHSSVPDNAAHASAPDDA